MEAEQQPPLVRRRSDRERAESIKKSSSFLMYQHIRKGIEAENSRRAMAERSTRAFKFKIDDEEDCPTSPVLHTSQLKKQSRLVIEREDVNGPLGLEAGMEDLMASLSKLVVLLLARFIDLQEKTKKNQHLFTPEDGNFRWDLMKKLCDLMGAASYKLSKVRMSLVPLEIREKPRIPSSSVSDLSEAINFIQLQLRQIQQNGKDISTMVTPMWHEEELVEGLGNLAQTVFDLPTHFGHCLEATTNLMHALNKLG